MSVSYNGWTAGSREDAHVVVDTVPGTKVVLPVNKAAAPLLLWVAEQFNLRVEKLHPEWCWGWADRLVRGSTTRTSNHASGTAIDLNAPKHPRGTAPTANFTKGQLSAIHAILAEVNEDQRMVDWGGDYRISPKDGMHFELSSQVSHADIARTMERLDNADPGKPPTLWMRGPKRPKWTRKLQRLLNASGDVGRIEVDGDFGAATRLAVKRYRRAHKIRPYAPGVAGSKVWRSLGVKW